MPLIELDRVSYRYTPDAAPALHDVTLAVERGEWIGVLGPTGSGKSTLLKVINGAVPHFHTGGVLDGTIRVDGHDVSATPLAELARRIGTVLQDPESQVFSLYVDDELTWGVQNLGVPKDEIERRTTEVVTWMGIDDLRGRITYDLSGGEKQKVCLASTLIMHPHVLLLDEPTAELDTLGTETVFDIIARLREQAATVVLVEHKLEYLVRYAQRVVLMLDGRILADIPPAELLRRPDLLEACGYRLPQVTDFFHRLDGAVGGSLPLPVSLEEAVIAARRFLEPPP